MRSVLVTIGGEIRHLRYPISAIEDIDQMLPGGFFSVFDRQADIQTAHLLLWAGLCHEGITYDDAGCILITEGAAYNPIILIGFWKKITDALINDGWVAITPGGSGDPVSIKDTLLEMERLAISEMDMQPKDFYGITPREFGIMRNNYGVTANRRTGIICATVANIHARGKDSDPYKPGDFIYTGERKKAQTAAEQAAILGGIL